MKKAGIIVGVTIILLAVGIYWFVGSLNKDKKDAEGENKPSASVISGDKPQIEPHQENQQTEPTDTEPVPQNQTNGSNNPAVNGVQDGNIEKVDQKQVFSEIDEQSLGNPVISRTEVLIVAKKKLLLLDTSYGTNEGKQLSYVIELIAGEGTLMMPVNGVAYDLIKIGDKLKVDYSVYRNESGVEFPVIMNAVTIQ